MKKITIIGGFGFVGQNLCEHFHQLGYIVNVVGRNSNNKDFSHLNVNEIYLNINQSREISEMSEGSDVIWLASSLIPGNHNQSLNSEFEENIKPVISFLEYVKENGTKISKFIYFSSGGTIYGDSKTETPIKEENEKLPISAYGLSKLITENYIRFLTVNSKFQSVILRPSNVYGKYQNLSKPQGIIGFALKAASQKHGIVLYNQGEVIRDFIHVNDVCNAIHKIVQKESKSGSTKIFNIGSGEGHSIADIVNIISATTDYTFPIQHKTSREFDCQFNVLDTAKFEDEYQWKCEIELKNGIQEVWEWIQK